MELIEQIGAYAGFAAVVGLAVLAALYFSQARDLRRLRDWAGRAPERAAQVEAEAQARAAQASRVVAQPQAKPGAAPAVPGAKPAEQPGVKPAEAPAGQPATPGAKPATPAARPGTAQPATPGAKPATPAGRPATAAAGATASAATAAAGASAKPGANGAGEPGKPPPIPARSQPAATTSILPPSARADARVPWYRRIAWPEPRYLAILAAGVIVVGGGAAFGISQLGGDDGGEAPPAAQPGEGGQPAGGGDSEQPAAVDPSTVTVSVLNGTTIGGLAADVADEVSAEGFLVGNVDNALDQAKAESVVLYAEGARREAQAVQRVLDIPQSEPVDPDSQQRGGNASVIVVLGADRTP